MNTKIMNYIKKASAAILAFSMMVTVIPNLEGQFTSSAKTKVSVPGKISTISSSVEGKDATINWSTSKNAKYYQVALRTSGKSWVYVKKVKKTSKNYKKYNKSGVYKTVKSGRRYKIYQYKTVYSYKTLRSKTTSRKYTYKGSNYNTTYTLAVRGVNYKDKTKKYGSWYAKSVKTATHDHMWEATYKDKNECTKTLTGYTCTKCGKFKDVADKVVGNHNSVVTEEYEKPLYKNVECYRRYDICQRCERNGIPLEQCKYYYDWIDENGIAHEWVDEDNVKKWYINSTPTYDKHFAIYEFSDEYEYGVTHPRSTRPGYDTKIEKKQVGTETHVRTYCRDCGKTISDKVK